MAFFIKEKIIFIHIPKNAGTSIYECLKSKYGVQNVGDCYGNMRGSCIMRGHHNAEKHINVIGLDEFNKYFKFCTVRNPWDRFVSNYTYAKSVSAHYQRCGNRLHIGFNVLENIPFEEALYTFYEHYKKTNRVLYKHPGWKPQYKFICDKNNNILIDKIFKYENLNTDKDFIKLVPNLPLLNKSEHLHYTKYYTNSSMIDIIKEIYKKDIELFDYSFIDDKVNISNYITE